MGASASKVWDEFTFLFQWSECSDGTAIKAGCCGLCGNTGMIDTRGRLQTPDGSPAGGILAFCICPNGRKRKRDAGLKTWDSTEVGHSVVDAPKAVKG